MIACRLNLLLVVTTVLASCGCQSSANRSDPFGMNTSAAGTNAANSSSEKPEFSSSTERRSGAERALLAEARWQADLGNSQIARKAYSSVLRKNSGSPEAIIGMARLDQAAGRLKEAEHGYQVGLALKPDDPAILSAVAQFYIAQERWHDARVTLQQAIEIDPADPALKHHMAVTLAKSGQEQLALEYFKSSSGESEAHYNFALIQYEQGEIVDCERHLMQSILLNPDFQAAKAWLADVREERRQRHLPEPQFESVPGDLAVTKSEPEPVAIITSEEAKFAAESRPSVTQAADSILSESGTDSNIEVAPSGEPGNLVLDSSRIQIKQTSVPVERPNERLEEPIGVRTPLLVGVPVEPLTNAGGHLRNAQPPQPLRKAVTASQQEQWENQLRMQKANR